MNNSNKQKFLTPYRLRFWAVAAFFALLLFVIVYKSIFVPITYDEKAAAVYYPQFSVIEIMKYPGNWPSNHILNTLCIKLSESIFGIEPWSVRLPNILAFVLLFSILYLIAIRYFNKSFFLFCLPFAIVFCNPYLLDFFGLARGYGISNALMGASVYCLLRYASSLNWRWFLLTIVLAMLAAYANFTLLIFWAAVLVLIGNISLINYIKNKESRSASVYLWTGTILLSVGFLALCYGPLYKMQSTNQFVYWSKKGFFSDTLVDQVSRFRSGIRYFGINNEFAAWAVIIFLVLTGVYVLVKIRKQRWAIFADPLFIVFSLLMAVWFVNMIQIIMLGTPYLNGRTALSYFVLFGFLLMFMLRDVSEYLQLIRITIVPVVVILFLINISLSIKLYQVSEWWFDANTYQVLDYLDGYKKAHPEVKTIDLNTNWLFNPSFTFYTSTGKAPAINISAQHMQVDTASNTLFYYAMKEDTGHIKNYNTVLSFGNGERVLMIRKK